jgi:hypothetical protein
MIWYKAWRETRTRFAAIAFVLTAFCLFSVFSYRPTAADALVLSGFLATNYSEHVYKIMYSGTAKGAFGLLLMFLGLGGLLRERRLKCAVFTLALPVSRAGLLAIFAAVGLGEMAVLALLPCALIPSLSLLYRQYYPLQEALHFSILWFGTGSVIFAAALFLSVVFEGEYTAPAGCFILFMFVSLLSAWKPLQPWHLNVFQTMGDFGAMHWDAQRVILLSDSLHWARLSVTLLIACAIFLATLRVMQKQDF